jgi:excisionase family DNA binding protein
MNNPFDALEERLRNIEALLLEIKGTPRITTSVEEKLLTIQEAAEFLTLAVPTLYGLVSKGSIPYSKKGKRLYFQKNELVRWVSSGRKQTKAESAMEADIFLSKNGTVGKRK